MTDDDPDAGETWQVGQSDWTPPASWDEIRARAAAGDQLADLALTLHEHAWAAYELRGDLDTWNDPDTPEETP